MKKTHFFVRHWVAAFAIAVMTVVIGAVSLVSLPVEQYPDIAPPMVTIQATYSGADAHAVMESVVMPLEEVVNGVENMIYMDATATSNGEGEIDIYFKQGTDADQATVNVQNRVSQASGVLPEEVIKAGVTVQKNVNATLMIMSLESTDGKFDQSFISNYLDINVMPAISRIAGVGRTMVMGEQYGREPFPLLSLEEYTDLVAESLRILPEQMVVHRMTGDGPGQLLIAPDWVRNKKKVLNTIQRKLRERTAGVRK